MIKIFPATLIAKVHMNFPICSFKTRSSVEQLEYINLTLMATQHCLLEFEGNRQVFEEKVSEREAYTAIKQVGQLTG